MSVIRLDVGPGVVSATYFVIFDLFLLAIVDVVLIHVVSWLYYKRIKKGLPLEVRSAEVPGVATSLVGRFYSPPNVLAYVIKITLLICIIIVDGNIETEFVRSRQQSYLSGTFKFDASEEAWPDGIIRIVERRWEEVRRCHVMNEEGTNITFYSIAFDLEDNITIVDEVVPNDEFFGYIAINDSTIQCLAKERVSNSEAYIIGEVVGCSTLDSNTRCSNETTIKRDFTDEQLQWNMFEQRELRIDEGSNPIFFLMQDYHLEDVQSIFPEYDSPELTCTRTRFGPPGPDGQILESCLLISVTSDNNTLIERWEIDRPGLKLVRRFPGPIFKGILQIGANQRAVTLQNVLLYTNWVSFSGQVIADGCVYSRASFNQIERIGRSVAKTTVPVYTVVLTAFLIFAACVARVTVAFTISKDDRPQLNTVNGLSSVAREENEPTGRSMTVGREMVIGLTKRDGRSIHFGPMTSRDVGVSRERGAFIE